MNQAPFLPVNHPQPNFLHWLGSLWKFSRPHTIIGTSLSVLSLYLIVIKQKDPLKCVTVAKSSCALVVMIISKLIFN